MPPSPPPQATRRVGKPSPTVSVVIPALNEQHNLPHVLAALPPVDEVLVVDGGSGDDTVAVARERGPAVRVLRQTRSGKGNALACGFAASTGDIVVTLHADGSTDPGELPRYLDALLDGADVAHGSRYRPGGDDLSGGTPERLGNAAFSRLVNAVFGTGFTDVGWGGHAFWRSVLPALDLPAPDLPGLRRGHRVWGDGPEIEPLLQIRSAVQGLRVVEIAGVGYPRIHGHDERRRLRRAGRALRVLFAEWRREHAAPVPAVAGLQTTSRYADPPGPRPRTPPVRYARRPGTASYRYDGSTAPVTPDAGRGPDGVAVHTTSSDNRRSAGGSLYDTQTGIGYDRSPARHDTTGGVRYRTSAPPAGSRRGGHRGTEAARHHTPTTVAEPRGAQHAATGAHHGIAPAAPEPAAHRPTAHEPTAPEPVNPLLRSAPPREVGGGRRRLESRQGRPRLTVVPGEGADDGGDPGTPGFSGTPEVPRVPAGPGAPAYSGGPGRSARPGHLRAVPGERHRR